VKTCLPEWVAYIVEDERLNLDIAILDTSSLHIHEAIIPELLKQLMLSIKADRCVKDPVIVDKESLVVLDGVHRVVALQRIGIGRIPACLVNYKSPHIQVCRWYRTITGAATPEQVLASVKEVGVAMKKVEEFDENRIGVSPTVATMRFGNQTFLVNSAFKNLREGYNIIGRIEERLKDSGFIVRYETEEDALRNLREGLVDAALCTPKISKEEIIDAALSGRVFAWKATRHIIPARPMGVNVSLNLLSNQKRSLAEVNDELKTMLEKRHLKRLPPGSLLNGRRYEEELYVFEE